MNLLILGPVPPAFGGKSAGGIATHIKGFSQAFAHNGHGVSVWYHKPYSTSSIENIKIIGNTLFSYILILKYFYLYFEKEISYLNFFRKSIVIFQYARLKRILKENQYDVIHIHAYFNTAGIALQLLGSKIPIVITDHGFWQEENFNTIMFKKMYKHNLRNAAKIIYISEYSLTRNLEFDFGQQEKLIKIKNPVNILIEKGNNIIRENEKIVIFFNGITESIKIKQLDVLLKAIQEDDFLRENVHLVTIADHNGIRYINELETTFFIEAYQSLSWDEVKKIYLKSDILVGPSTSECFSTVYMESLSFGKPIVGFKDNIDELRDYYKTYIGEDFLGRNSEELALKIKKVIANQVDSNELISKSQELFSWNTNFKNFENLFQSLIENK